MQVRSILGSLQLPVAALGGVLVVGAVGGVAGMPSPPPDSEGFVSGLAVLALYFFGWVGFLLLAGGLAIPPGDGYGISFTRYQRGLFIFAAVAGFLSAIVPFALFGLLLSNPSLIGTAWLALMGLAITALILGLLWRTGQAIQSRRHDQGHNSEYT